MTPPGISLTIGWIGRHTSKGPPRAEVDDPDAARIRDTDGSPCCRERWSWFSRIDTKLSSQRSGVALTMVPHAMGAAGGTGRASAGAGSKP